MEIDSQCGPVVLYDGNVHWVNMMADERVT